MNEMMHSTGVLIALMVLLVLLLGGMLIGVRMLGGKAFNEDHDR
jgi:flagellar basal body-associated protein FliL